MRSSSQESTSRHWRLGIIGCGWAGERHAQSLLQLADRVELGAIADIDVEVPHFLDCLDAGVEPITSGRDQRKPLLAVLATYASIRDGKRVYLAEFDRTHSTLGPLA